MLMDSLVEPTANIKTRWRKWLDSATPGCFNPTVNKLNKYHNGWETLRDQLLLTFWGKHSMISSCCSFLKAQILSSSEFIGMKWFVDVHCQPVSNIGRALGTCNPWTSTNWRGCGRGMLYRIFVRRIMLNLKLLEASQYEWPTGQYCLNPTLILTPGFGFMPSVYFLIWMNAQHLMSLIWIHAQSILDLNACSRWSPWFGCVRRVCALIWMSQ